MHGNPYAMSESHARANALFGEAAALERKAALATGAEAAALLAKAAALKEKANNL